MGIRRTVGQSIERFVGPDKAARVRSAEARARSRIIDVLDLEGTRPVQSKHKASKPKPAPKKPTREELIAFHGGARDGISHAGKGSLPWATSDPYADFPPTTATRHSVLVALHEALRPRTYFEIGVDKGQSMTLSRTKSIGVDPDFKIDREISCDVHIVKDTSDHFFETTDLFDTHFGGVPVDLAFIDGMHLAEYALRDFMNIEKKMARTGVVVLDDMLPRNSLEAFRKRRTALWAGDVYKVHYVLAKYRPDLTLVPMHTHPTGSYLVVGLDPSSTVLEDNYAQIEAEITGDDPQDVPQEWVERRGAVDPEALLGLEVWKQLATLRDTDHSDAELSQVWAAIKAQPSISR